MPGLAYDDHPLQIIWVTVHDFIILGIRGVIGFVPLTHLLAGMAV